MQFTPATDAAIRKAATILKNGGLVAFPSETVYGLGADATNPTAAARIFEAKQRPHFDPLIVHLGDVSWLARFVSEVNEDASKLAKTFWPGPLTLVLPKRGLIADIVTSGLSTVAVRVPSHPVAHALIVAADRPIAAPSANRFGHISPTTAQAVQEELGEAVDMILDGGPTTHGLESTIVGFEGNEPRILRPGPVTREQLRECLGRDVTVQPPGDMPIAPGQLPRHYAPTTPMRVVPSIAELRPACGMRVGLMAFQKPAGYFEFSAIEILSERGDLREAAANLFGAMRRLDAARLDWIVAEAVPETGLGLAIMDRLRKAAAP